MTWYVFLAAINLFVILFLKTARIQISVMVIVSIIGRICSLFSPLPRTQRFLLMDFEHVVWISANIWIHNDDSTIIHQLQTEVCRSSSMEDAHIQVFEHVH